MPQTQQRGLTFSVHRGSFFIVAPNRLLYTQYQVKVKINSCQIFLSSVVKLKNLTSSVAGTVALPGYPVAVPLRWVVMPITLTGVAHTAQARVSTVRARCAHLTGFSFRHVLTVVTVTLSLER